VGGGPVADRPPRAAPAPSDAPAPGWPLWAAAAWGAGALLGLARFAAGSVGLARLARRARPADDPAWGAALQRLARELGVRRPVTLLVGRAGTVPVTWGVVYPVVLLPADADAWSAERRRLVLLHELAHVARLDALTQLLARLAGAVFWFNPLVALAARRLRAERERACDDLVLAAGVRATAYADDLLDLVRTLGAAPAGSAALAMARRSEFEGRLLAILDPAAPRARTSARRALAAATLAGAVSLPLAGMRAAVAGGGAGAPSPWPPAGVGPAGGPAAPAAPAPPAPREPNAVAVASGAPRLAAPVAAEGAAGLPASDAPAPVSGAAPELAAPRPPQPPAPPATPATPRRGGPTVDGCGRVPSDAGIGEGTSRESAYRHVGDGRCLEVYIRGDVDFTDDRADVRAAGPRGAVVVTESGGRGTRRMVVAPEGGALARRYSVNGAPRPVAEGAAWFRGVLTEVVASGRLSVGRSAAADAAPRQVHASAAAGSALPPAVVADLARAAGGVASDADKAAVLARLTSRLDESEAVRSAYFGAVASMTSDAERRRLLLGVLDATRDPAVVPAVLDALAPMTSDAERTAVLTAVAARHPLDAPAVRERYFARVEPMTSDAARERELLAALERGPASGPVVRAVLASLGGVTSDHTRANVLVALAARTDAVRAPASRAAFLAALRSLTSGSEYRRVMEAVLPR
jgi:hypothetical protein